MSYFFSFQEKIVFNVELCCAGLFQRVVLMSGSALSPWALNHQAGKLKAEVARQMDCEPFAGSDGAASAEQMSLADIGDCLRKKPLESLMAVRLPAPPRFFASFAPFVDGAGIVAIDPLRAMQSASEDFARIPLVAGVTSIESYRYTG
jgi:neuroligin